MFFSSFNELYEKIIFEAEYDTDKWQRFDTYKDIEIYYNIDHIKQRLANRYPLYRLGNIRQFVITFLKTLIKNNWFENTQKTEESFTCHCTRSNVWVSGRLKQNRGRWRIYISTLLPSSNPMYSKNDYRADLNI